MVVTPEVYTDYNPAGSGTPIITPFSAAPAETDSSDNDCKDSVV